MFAECACELRTTIEPVFGPLGKTLGENRVQVGQLWPLISECRRLVIEMTADYDCRIRMREQLRTGQLVKCGGRQRVLVSSAVDFLTE